MHEVAPLIYDLAIMLGLAGFVVIIFQRIRQPVVLGYLVAGMIVGPYTPPHSLVSDVSNIQLLSELGVIFLMFSLGLEFSFQKLTRVGFSASLTGIIEVISMMAIGFSVGALLGWSRYDCLFLGAALSISSTTIIIKAIEELRLKTKHFAAVIFGILIVEDLLAILLLVALSTIVVTQNIFSFDMINAIVRLVLVVGGWFIVGYFVVPTLMRKIAMFISEESLTIISTALCLFLVCVAGSFNYSPALGAFIMGSILAETPLVHRIIQLIRPIRDIFAAVFFISVGMLFDPIKIAEYWPIVLLLATVTIVGKLLTTTIGALLTGQNLSTAVRIGFSMAQVGEFSFIIASLGVALHATNNILYPIIVAVSGVTTFTTPYLIRISGFIAEYLDKNLPPHIKQRLNTFANRTQRNTSAKALLYRGLYLRLAINGIIVAIVFTLVHYLVFHRFAFFPEKSWAANTFFLLLALMLSSPFIWGMLFSSRMINHPKDQKFFPTRIYVIWFLTLTEITLLSIIYFNTWITFVFLFSIALALFVFTYKHLEKSYAWFEQQLIRNIKLEEDETEEEEKKPPSKK